MVNDIICLEVRKMPDYKEMYLHLMRETEKAARILIKAQQDCEEMYLSASDPEPISLESSPAKETASGGLLFPRGKSNQKDA